jgi:hypothetical protein
MGKRLGRRLTKRVNDGGAEARIRARKRGAPRAGRTDGDEVCHGVLGVRTEERKGGRSAAASYDPFLKGAGEAGGRWGSGGEADVWRMQGTSSERGSLPTGERRPAGSGPNSAGARDVRRARRPNRGEEWLTGGPRHSTGRWCRR